MIDFKSYIIDIIDFPIKGIVFKDITPMLTDCFSEAIEAMVDLYPQEFWEKVDHIAGIEARGFIFAAALASRLNKGFVPIRKHGKLPRPAGQIKYSLEYGDTIAEMHAGKGNLLIVDDIIATGGTIAAGATLASQVGFTVCGICTFIDLGLNKRLTWNNIKTKSIVYY
jgi:adenine phosphoribosyltransferase